MGRVSIGYGCYERLDVICPKCGAILADMGQASFVWVTLHCRKCNAQVELKTQKDGSLGVTEI